MKETMTDKVLLSHGSGGQMSHELITGLFVKHFHSCNEPNGFLTDSSIINPAGQKIAFTTDSYVVNPVFFPGGNIGKLAVCGTVNDLAVSGAHPKYISASFIIEEGFDMDELEQIVESMAGEAKSAGVQIITGDTKVVNKGKCDKVFINTAGIGFISEQLETIGSGKQIMEGDKVIINGSLGDHSIAVMAARKELNVSTDILSDCASLNDLISSIVATGSEIKFMRDITRGGLATVLCELAGGHHLGIDIKEESLPVKDAVKGVCEVLGFDPLYLANEGKLLFVVSDKDAAQCLHQLKKHPLGKKAAIVGEVIDKHPGKVVMHTTIGGNRIVDMLAGEQLPRIC